MMPLSKRVLLILMNVKAADCLLLDVCNEAVLNKADFMLCDMWGGGLLCVATGTNRKDVWLI